MRTAEDAWSLVYKITAKLYEVRAREVPNSLLLIGHDSMALIAGFACEGAIEVHRFASQTPAPLSLAKRIYESIWQKRLEKSLVNKDE